MMSFVRAGICAIALSILAVIPHLAAAQAVTALSGSITGTVSDESGAVIPGATVTITSPSQMGTRESVTTRQGEYRFPAIAPGEYTVTVALPGFTTVKVEGVRVTAGFTATIDAGLRPATVDEQITVSGRAPIVDLAATRVSTTVDQATLANLPNSRDLYSLFSQIPAVANQTVDVGGSNYGQFGNATAYGSRAQSRILVEGIDSSFNCGCQAGFFYNVGSLDEVQVNAVANGADVAMPGLQVQMIGKSGSNEYHGSLFGNFEHGRLQSFNIDSQQVARGVTGGGGLSARDTNRLSHFYDIDGGVGGYIKRDRVWWYSSSRIGEVATRVPSLPTEPTVIDQWNVDAKATAALTPTQKLIGYVAWNRELAPTRFNSLTLGIAAPAFFPTRADTVYADFRATLFKVEWNGVLNDRTFIEARVGDWDSISPFAKQPDQPIRPHYEDLTTRTVTGSNIDRYLYNHKPQSMLTVSTARGNHTLKFGTEYFRDLARFTVNEGSYGDVTQVLQNGAPIEVYLMQHPIDARTGQDTYGAYATDSWRPLSRLTVNLGLRFDRYHGFFPEQVHPASRFAEETRFPAADNLYTWNLFAPRLGAAWALDESQRTVVKLNTGTYWWNASNNLLDAVNPNSRSWWRRYTWTDPNGDLLWQSGEEGRLLGTSGGTGSASIEPDLRNTYTREAAGWIERSVAGTTSVRTGVVWRGDRQTYLNLNQNAPYAAFNVPVSIPDPGPDGVAGTTDDGRAIDGFNLAPEYLGLPSIGVVTNVPNVRSDFWIWEASAVRRLANHWSMMASASKTWASAQALPGTSSSTPQVPVAFSPNRTVNAGPNGELRYTTWTAKAHATWEAPMGFIVTPALTHQSGQPFGRLVSARFNFGTAQLLAEPVDSRRTSNITMVDLRVEKRVRLGVGGASVGTFVDVLNLTNANPEQQVITTSGPNFLRPTQILPPRIIRFGGRFEW